MFEGPAPLSFTRAPTTDKDGTVGWAPRDRVRAEATRLLAAGVGGRVFPGATAAVAWRDDAGTEQRVFAFAGERAPGGPSVDEHTLYDLGRVTEVAVGLAALSAEARGALDLGRDVERVLPAARGGALAGVSLRALFEHEAGLEAWGGLYLDVPHEHGSPAARRWLLAEAARRTAEGAAGPSDLGFLIAGEAMAQALSAPLEQVVEREVLAPLGLVESVRYVSALPTDRRVAVAARCASTERCEWRGRLLRGEVHDENAFALGGVAAHAGLFATSAGILGLGWAVLEALEGRSELVPGALLADALTPGGERWGFAPRVDADGLCGRHMSATGVGQVGFPGTSLYVNPERGVVAALLSNRICPSRANQKIDGFRPAFYDGLMAALLRPR